MTNDIQLNLDTDLSFQVINYNNSGTVSRIRYSASGKKFVDIERTTDVGHIAVKALDTSEHVATVNGEKIYGEVNFAATQIETPNGTVAMLWNVYNFAEELKDDLDIEEVGSSEIPDPIIDMLL